MAGGLEEQTTRSYGGGGEAPQGGPQDPARFTGCCQQIGLRIRVKSQSSQKLSLTPQAAGVETEEVREVCSWSHGHLAHTRTLTLPPEPCATYTT